MKSPESQIPPKKFTRREFIENAAIAAAGGVVTGTTIYYATEAQLPGFLGGAVRSLFNRATARRAAVAAEKAAVRRETVPPPATATPTATEAAPAAATATPLPPTVSPDIPAETATAEMPLIKSERLKFGAIDFGSPEPVTFTYTGPSSETITATVTPKILEQYQRKAGDGYDQQAFNADFEHADTLAQCGMEMYGNAIFYVHSGYHGSRRLPAEPIRRLLEGYSGRSDTTNDRNRQAVRKSAGDLIGGTVTISQNGQEERFIILAVGLIPHDHLKTAQTTDDKHLLETLIDTDGGDGSPFTVFRNQHTHGILMEFCGWSQNLLDTARYSSNRYVIGLIPEKSLMP